MNDKTAIKSNKKRIFDSNFTVVRGFVLKDNWINTVLWKAKTKITHDKATEFDKRSLVFKSLRAIKTILIISICYEMYFEWLLVLSNVYV